MVRWATRPKHVQEPGIDAKGTTERNMEGRCLDDFTSWHLNIWKPRCLTELPAWARMKLPRLRPKNRIKKKTKIWQGSFKTVKEMVLKKEKNESKHSVANGSPPIFASFHLGFFSTEQWLYGRKRYVRPKSLLDPTCRIAKQFPTLN